MYKLWFFTAAARRHPAMTRPQAPKCATALESPRANRAGQWATQADALCFFLFVLFIWLCSWPSLTGP
jgi:hypothetical protein